VCSSDLGDLAFFADLLSPQPTFVNVFPISPKGENSTFQ